MRNLITLVLMIALLSGCASNTLDNPNLNAPIDPTKAEVVGSKIVGEGGIPGQIFASYVDGKQLRYVAVDQTLHVFPIEPGVHDFRVEYVGSTGKVFIRPFTAEGRIKAELKAGHRYIVKIRPAAEDKIVFYFEDLADGSEVAPTTDGGPLPAEFGSYKMEAAGPIIKKNINGKGTLMIFAFGMRIKQNAEPSHIQVDDVIVSRLLQFQRGQRAQIFNNGFQCAHAHDSVDDMPDGKSSA